ncbi:MAG: F0F1 ATP synthase subunit epsilon [Dehalococcoidia bacterium]|nr:F0F1 ATP synthase subunit epsilon [Dehalococcoidia bacterium]
MPTLRLEVVTAERLIFSEEVSAVIAPGVEGQLGILPHHARLMTVLQPGELIIRKGDEEISLAIGGGYLEVRPDKVIVLADSAERAEEIDIARAEAARKRAEEAIKLHPTPQDLANAEAALRRSLARLKVAQKRRAKPAPPI